MREHFKLPDVGEGLTEAEIVTWRVAPGDTGHGCAEGTFHALGRKVRGTDATHHLIWQLRDERPGGGDHLARADGLCPAMLQ